MANYSLFFTIPVALFFRGAFVVLLLPGGSRDFTLDVITFPEESPTRSDFQYWRDCLRAITSASHTFGQVLGPYVAKSHVHHRWFVADDEGELFYRFEDNGENMHSVFAKEQAAYDTRFGR